MLGLVSSNKEVAWAFWNVLDPPFGERDDHINKLEIMLAHTQHVNFIVSDYIKHDFVGPNYKNKTMLEIARIEELTDVVDILLSNKHGSCLKGVEIVPVIDN